MANTTLFASTRGTLLPAATTFNEAGGLAYARKPQAALALYAATGCLNGTYYANAEQQLATVLKLCAEVEPRFVAQTAMYARQCAHMKDMPALLLASLSLRDREVFAAAFPRVVDNGRLLRNVVQILRSGCVGRKSLGSLPKRLVREWLQRASVEQIVNAAIGNDPSLADVIRMVHPKPADAEREALYAWVIGKPYDGAKLPEMLRAYEAFKRDAQGELPALPFQYFTSLPLNATQWTALARRASWQSLRMNLNTFARNGVFEDAKAVAMIAERLRHPESIRRARVFPYQLLTAFQATSKLPNAIGAALQDAMEVATRNVPKLEGAVVVAVDVSGSMASPATGHRKGATTTTRCVDVAALIGACIQRTHPDARVLPFDTAVRALRLNPRDSVMTQARQLAALCGGGTSVSAPLAALNHEKAKVDLLVLVSDNESWRDTRSGGATETMRQWEQIKVRCPQAKLVCIDLQPVARSNGRAQRCAPRRRVQRRGVRSDREFRGRRFWREALGREDREHRVLDIVQCPAGNGAGRARGDVFVVVLSVVANAGKTTPYYGPGRGFESHPSQICAVVAQQDRAGCFPTLVAIIDGFDSSRVISSGAIKIMRCNGGNNMSEVWAIIVIVILVLIVYGIVSSKLSARRQREAREKMLPYLDETIVPDRRHNLFMSDGRKFMDVRILGTTDPKLGQSPLGDWGLMLVILMDSGKKAFIRPSSVRCIEEA